MTYERLLAETKAQDDLKLICAELQVPLQTNF